MDVSKIIDSLDNPVEYLHGDDRLSDYGHDEALTAEITKPDLVFFPKDVKEVISIVKAASTCNLPITPRGAGSGMSGGCIPCENSVVVSFEKMNKILELDLENQVAVLEPGVRLFEIEEALAVHGLTYPVYPGELSATIGGNVATNAGGMRAIKHGVTRNHILGLHVVLADGRVLKTGGKFTKSSVGYDLTQLFIGSEGTLGLITQVTIKLSPKPRYEKTLLTAFDSLEDIASSIPKLLAAGLAPSICEYIDMLAMAAITSSQGVELGIPKEVIDKTTTYLVLNLESNQQEHLDYLVEKAGEILTEHKSIDIFVLSGTTARQLIEAREKAFFVAKASGANDIIDVVVPRSEIASYLSKVSDIAKETGSFVSGCGHVGDGNVHLSLFQPDHEKRKLTMVKILKQGVAQGGAISGEHGIGTEKRDYFMEIEDPIRIEILKKLKKTLDPDGIFNPGHMIS